MLLLRQMGNLLDDRACQQKEIDCITDILINELPMTTFVEFYPTLYVYFIDASPKIICTLVHPLQICQGEFISNAKRQIQTKQADRPSVPKECNKTGFLG